MKVTIVTEGSKFIGFGHITRCTSLYQAFEEKDILPVFIINGDGTVKDLLYDKHYEIFNWLDNKNKLFDSIRDADIVIIDSYIAEYKIYENASQLTKILACIDDNRRIEYPGGFIINGTIYAEDLNYPKRKDVTYLLGSKYIPLRKEFWDVPEKEIKENIQTVMVTFGGDDARNMTPGILKLLEENFPKLIKKVIIGKGFKNIERIESLKNGKTELIYYPNAEDMKRVMLESDIAISASGQTLYELARVGVPTIAIAVAENQMNNAKGWQKAGFIEYAGWWEDKNTLNAIASKIKLLRAFDLRKEKSTMGRCYVDGLGASRVVELVTNVKL
jgi:UDP-2,4-diacetamido-2,4,6-trideoxy-beta-L-altropyranose hydrolase